MVKFLIIRFSSIGDILLTTPVVRCLKNQIEDSEIHYLTKKKFAHLLENNPHVDKIHTIERHTSEVLKKLQEENFDHIIDLHKNLRSGTVKSKLKIPALTFDKLNFQKWLLVNFKIDKLPDTHIVDRYMEPVHLFDVSDDGAGLDYYFSDKAPEHTSLLSKKILPGYVAYSLGANHATKRMPVDKVIELIKKINLPVVLLGGDDVSDEALQITTALPSHTIENGCGKFNFTAAAKIVSNAKIVISYDSGLMHLASAFKKDIVSIWGNTVPKLGMFPYRPGDRSKIFEVHPACRPCSKIGYKKCPKKHFKCMRDQNIDAMASYVNELITT